MRATQVKPDHPASDAHPPAFSSKQDVRHLDGPHSRATTQSGKKKLHLATACIAILLSPPLAQTAHAEQFGFGMFPQQTGEAIYKGVCQGCHMPDAKGAAGAGAYPALANNPKLQDAGYPVFLVVNGHKAMPPFGDSFSNSQVANVVNYVRTHFGNNYTDTVKPSDVQAVRPEGPKPAPKKNMHE
jgi:cytochrome c5